MRLGAKIVLLAGVGFGPAFAVGWRLMRAEAPQLDLCHAPAAYARRTDDLSANLTGVLTGPVRFADYRLNQGVWRPIGRGLPRAAPPSFVVEMQAAELQPGRNRVALRAFGTGGAVTEVEHVFVYDPKPLALPLAVDWRGELDAQDGEWDRVERDGEAWVRPRPGREDYDRLLLATGSFAGGRRIRGSLVLRQASPDRKWGCGILSLWGGHPDDPSAAPRRGWRFGLSWYYSHYRGVGAEFSGKQGGEEARWIHAYRGFELLAGTRYRILIECWPENDESGRHQRWRQRAKWWRDGGREPATWIEVTDTEGSPLPAGEYAVGLLAHRCQVEFGSLSIEPLPARSVPAAAAGR